MWDMWDSPWDSAVHQGRNPTFLSHIMPQEACQPISGRPLDDHTKRTRANVYAEHRRHIGQIRF
jgi:hypothetical protein